jgi:AhpD family alkylhydroperoxidase
MTQRLNYIQQSPELFKKFLEFSNRMKEAAIEQSIIDLVQIRASQMNGCAFCVDMHVKEAKRVCIMSRSGANRRSSRRANAPRSRGPKC